MPHTNRPLAIGPEACESGEGGDMDLELAVDALVQLVGSTPVPNKLEHPRTGRSSTGLLPSSLVAYPGSHPTGSAD